MRQHIPEYLVISDYFIQLAAEYDLRVEVDQNFHSFYADNIRRYFPLFEKIGFNRSKGKDLMDEALWECSYLYKIVMLRKTKGEPVKTGADNKFQKDSYWEIKNDYDDLYSSGAEFN